jgi:DNA-directed RNA polymerase specialized sigma24 family protein
MTGSPFGSPDDRDWMIDLNQSPEEPRTDPRLPVVREAVRAAQAQLQTVAAMLQSMESVIRECAADGMTADEIADQCSLTRESVERVLSGGALFNLPPA